METGGMEITEPAYRDLRHRYYKTDKESMERNKIIVDVSWTGDNFCCAWNDGQGGGVLVTAKTFQKLKEDFTESLHLHIEGCIADGDSFPEYLTNGNYDIEYRPDAAALIRNAEAYTTMSAISRVSGINQKQLSHYANGLKHPRPLQLERIKSALSEIGTQLLALS